MEEPDSSFDVFMVVKDKATERLSCDITKFIDACKQVGVTLRYVRHPESISDALTRSKDSVSVNNKS